MRAKRKLVTMLVTVSVPADRTAEGARRRARDLLRIDFTVFDMKVRAVQPAARLVAMAEKAEQAWGKPKHPKPRKRDGTPPLLAAMEGK